MYNRSKPTQTDDPAFRCAAHLEQAPVWTLLKDIYDGAEVWLGRDEFGMINPTPKARVYLPREPAESDKNYIDRLARSPYNDFFRQAVRKSVNLVFANPLRFDPEFQGAGTIDNRGTSAESFLRHLAAAVIRDGHSFVLVDFPPVDPTVRSQADYLASGRRPYWLYYPACDVLNWRTGIRNGQTVLTQVTLRETTIIPAGDFGETPVERYRVLHPGGWLLYQQGKDSQGRQVTTLIDGGETTLPYIPLVPVFADVALQTGFFASRPPLMSLARLNLTHYQVKSDHLRKVHLCCLPIPELRDAMRDDSQPFVLGPTTLIHIRDPNGSFNWKEPLATSIIESRREVQDLEAAADILSAGYLTAPADRQAALSTVMQANVVESDLQSFVQAFTAGINRCLEIDADYRQSQPSQVFLSSEVLREKGTDSQMLMALTALTEKDLLSKRSFLELLTAQNFLPEQFDVEQEIQRVGEQIQLVAIGSMLSSPAPDNTPLKPPIDPAIVVGAYVDLAKAGLLTADQVLQIIHGFALPAKTSSPATP